MNVEHAVWRTILSSLAQAAIGWMTLALVLFVAIFYGGNAPSYWTLMGFVVVVLFAMQIALTMIRGGHRANGRLLVPAVLYLAALSWGLVQTLPGLPEAWAHPFWALAPDAVPTISATPIAGAHGVFRLAAYAMVFWIAVQASINSQRTLWFLKVFATFSALMALFGLHAVISNNNLVLGEQATGHVSATFINRNSYALYAAFGLLANLGVYIDMVRSRDVVPTSAKSALRGFVERFFSGAWVFLFGAVVCVSALLLTASRAGIASGLLATVVLVVLLQRNSAGSRAIWVSVAVLLGAFITFLSENVLTRFAGTGVGEMRFVIYREMQAHLGDRLMLGHGIGAFQDSFRQHVPFEAASAEWSLAHSSYLENLWEMGLPAALAFYAALVWVAVVIVRGAITRKRNRIYSVVALSCLVAGGLHSLVDFSLQMPATSAMFAFLLGIGWAHAWPSIAVRNIQSTDV